MAAPVPIPNAPALAMAATALEGTYIYVHYGGAGEPWNELVILAHVFDNNWVVMNPDMDMYVEELGSPPLHDVKMGVGARGLPAGLGARYGNPVYRFAKPFSAAIKPRDA